LTVVVLVCKVMVLLYSKNLSFEDAHGVNIYRYTLF